MPALQVRDFPEGLYEDLKNFAEANHRSMSQQVIVAVEEMLERGLSGQPRSCPYGTPMTQEVYDTEAARQARIAKRKELFARIHETSKNLPKDLPDPVEVLRECRSEREERLMKVILEAGGPAL